MSRSLQVLFSSRQRLNVTSSSFLTIPPPVTVSSPGEQIWWDTWRPIKTTETTDDIFISLLSHHRIITVLFSMNSSPQVK